MPRWRMTVALALALAWLLAACAPYRLPQALSTPPPTAA